MADLRFSESISLIYFAALAAMAWVRPVSVQQRLAVAGVALTVALAIGVVATLNSFAVQIIRDWLPAALLLLAYWTPSRLVTGTNPAFERWLLRTDRALFSSPLGTKLLNLSPVVRELLELSYLLVYLLIPAAFGLLVVHGLRGDADRFWTVVIGAEYLCYGLLPLLPTRPPRSVESRAQPVQESVIRSFNLRILGRASNQWNTFPSGHVAGSVACALVVWSLLPIAGAALLVLTVGIAVGSVVGRYHYAMDVLAGVAIAIVVFRAVFA